jgi:L-lactate dehydrogenase complex protein LldF
VEQGDAPLSEKLAMKAAAFTLAGPVRLSSMQKLARLAQLPFEQDGELRDLPGMLSNWTSFRDMPAIPKESFREWWAKREQGEAT